MSPAQKTGLPLPLHGAVGSTLHGMRNTLLTASVFLSNTYGKQAGTRVYTSLKALDRVRCRLDTYVFVEYPTLAKAGHVYYPGEQSVALVLLFRSLEGVCQYLAAASGTLQTIANVLYRHYPVGLGDRVNKIGHALRSQALELPHVVGPPKQRPRGGAAND